MAECCTALYGSGAGTTSKLRGKCRYVTGNPHLAGNVGCDTFSSCALQHLEADQRCIHQWHPVKEVHGARAGGTKQFNL